MLPTKIYTFTIASGNAQRMLIAGQYFKILSATGAVSVSSDFGKLDSLISGQGLENTAFPYLLFENVSGASNTIRVLIGDQNFIDGFTGNMSITDNKVAQSGSFANVQSTVTNASTQLVAANGARQYLLIQNKDNAGSIYINFGSAATVANGVRVIPGGALELDAIVSTQAIFAISDIASNANVVTVQG